MEKGGDPDLAILIATLNEEKGLEPTIMELMEFLTKPHILVVDGNSADGTIEVAKRLGLNVVLQNGTGKGCAIGQALDCLDIEPRFVIFIDADFTYPAEYLPNMIRIAEENPEVGMVCGNRFGKPFSMSHMNSLYYVGNRFLALVQNLVNGVDMQDPLTGLRVIKYEVLKGWRPRSRGFDLEAELNYLIEKKGFQIREVPIHYRRRLGEKKLKLKHGLAILNRILVESLRQN
jgi:dolichol-phosphate mannosyltransferase